MAELVAAGEAEIGMQQIVAIVPVNGAELVGPLPSELQNVIVYAAGLRGRPWRSRGSGAHFVAFLARRRWCALIRAKGMEPASRRAMTARLKHTCACGIGLL